jgi:cytoskeletal protein CcmA (bactofilin family)
MSRLGKSISVKGEVRADESVIVEGHIEGAVVCERDAVVLAESCDIKGDVIANNITVFGKVNGKLIATDFVDLRSASDVFGQVLSKRFILDDGAQFQGRVEPQHLDAALRVAKFQQNQQKRKDAG